MVPGFALTGEPTRARPTVNESPLQLRKPK